MSEHDHQDDPLQRLVGKTVRHVCSDESNVKIDFEDGTEISVFGQVNLTDGWAER